MARKLVTRNEPHFNGHFPGHPVMPGVLIIEAMAQAGALLAASLVSFDPAKQVIYFLGIDKARFRKPVVPGDLLVLEVVPLRKGGAIWKLRGEAKVRRRAGRRGRVSWRRFRTSERERCPAAARISPVRPSSPAAWQRRAARVRGVDGPPCGPVGRPLARLSPIEHAATPRRRRGGGSARGARRRAAGGGRHGAYNDTLASRAAFDAVDGRARRPSAVAWRRPPAPSATSTSSGSICRQPTPGPPAGESRWGRSRSPPRALLRAPTLKPGAGWAATLDDALDAAGHPLVSAVRQPGEAIAIPNLAVAAGPDLSARAICGRRASAGRATVWSRARRPSISAPRSSPTGAPRWRPSLATGGRGGVRLSWAGATTRIGIGRPTAWLAEGSVLSVDLDPVPGVAASSAARRQADAAAS